MNNIHETLVWITNILKKHDITFQVAGGLAVQAYGSDRKLIDIDIDIPEKDFEKIKGEVSQYITFGPENFKDNVWDIYLMTLNYHGQAIDLSGVDTTKVFNVKEKIWEKLITDYSKVNYIEVYGITLPIINRQALIEYKKILARHVDILDVAYLEHNNRNTV